MKAIIALLIIFNSAIVSEQYAEFSFEKRIHKFKPVKEGKTIEHTFKFTNTGDEPLIISNYSVECDCTKAEYSNAPIMPGEAGEIRVTFDTKGKIGWQYRKILLYANTKKTPYWIEIRVKVINE
jgi:hypothetical protein